MMAVTPMRSLSLTLAISLWIGFAPLAVANATDEGWLDRVTALVRQHQDVVQQYGSGAAYDAYLIHLRMVRQALSKGDVAGTYHMMNQFMDMLESRAGGIPGWSATALYDYCGMVTPPQYHDLSRHLPRT